MIKLEILRTLFLISQIILSINSAEFKSSLPREDIIYPAAPFLSRRAGVGNETQGK